MNLRTRNEAEYKPLLVSEAVNVPTSYTDGPSQDGIYTEYFLRDAVEGYYNHLVTTDADEITNLSPTVLDLSEWPLVKRAADYTANQGTIEYRKGGARYRRDYRVGNIGTLADLYYTTAVKAGTMLEYFHNLVITAASAPGKDDFFFRTKSTGVPVQITSGTMYQTVEPNPNCWVSQWDLTGVPIWLSAGSGGGGGPNHGGVPITSRHFVEAEHYHSPVGTEWKWMLADGSLVSRTSIGVNARPAGVDQAQTQWLNEIPGDIRIHTLNAPLPAGVKVYPIVGPWARIHKTTGSPSTSYPWQTPVSYYHPLVGFYLDQRRRAWFMGRYDFDAVYSVCHAIAEINWNGTPIALNYTTTGLGGGAVEGALKTQIDATGRMRLGISGDSGSALLVPLNSTDLALLTCLTVPGGGPCYEEARMNLLIASADADAIARGNLASPTGLTVSVAADPTL